MDNPENKHKYSKKSKGGSTKSQEEQHIEEKTSSTDNAEDIEFSSPTSAPPKLYSGSLFLYANDPFGCFTNENQTLKEEQQYNKFFNYMKTGKEGNQKPTSYSQGDIDAIESRENNNFNNPIHETKSDLDISDIIGRQSSSLADSRLSPDPANKALIDIFEDQFTLTDSATFNHDSANGNRNHYQSGANKNKTEKEFKRNSPKRYKENHHFPQPSVMVPQMGFMQNPYMGMPNQPYAMPQNYGFPLNDTGYRRVNQYPGTSYFPDYEYSHDSNNFGNNINNKPHMKYQSQPTKREDNHKKDFTNSRKENNIQVNKKDKKQVETKPINDNAVLPTDQGNKLMNLNPEELENLIQNASKLAKDQTGCRMLQKEIEAENSEVVQRIFESIIQDFGQLMIDPFGNYLCQKITEMCSNEQMKRIIQSVSQELPEICFNPHGTRAVQKLIEVIKEQDLIEMLIESLAKDVVGLVKDNNGNHVIQKCLTSMSDRNKQFIYDSIVENCINIATHKHGCCVIQRCLDFASKKQKIELSSVVAENAYELVKDQYGNYVVQYVLEMKDTEQKIKQRIADELTQDIIELSKQKFSSNVVEKCLQSGILSIRKQFMNLLMNDEILIEVVRDKFANYVLQRFLANGNEEEKSNILQTVINNADIIKNDPFGGKIYAKISKNYNLQEDLFSTSNPSLSPLLSGSDSNNSRQNSRNDKVRNNDAHKNVSKRQQHVNRNNDKRMNFTDGNKVRRPSNSNQQNNVPKGPYGNTIPSPVLYPQMGGEMLPPGFGPTMMQPNFFIPQPQMYNQYYNYPPPQQGMFYPKIY